MNRRISDYENFQWIDLENPTEKAVQELNLPFTIDLNFLEDALETGHLPKIEQTPDYVFMILRAYTATEDEKAIEVGQISNKIAFFIHKHSVVTIHRAPFPLFDGLPENFDFPNELVLYLVNALLATFEVPIKSQADKMDRLEQIIFLNKRNTLSLEELYFEKSKARLSKKILVIMQGVVHQFKVEDALSSNLHDLKDTLLNLILRTEEVVEDANALLNTYMTFTAQKNNDVMKLLTVFSAFFLPLTFIAGVYGMNFDHMPELHWHYGYFVILGLMLVIALGVYIWFRNKRIL